jgi:hypothetical protein
LIDKRLWRNIASTTLVPSNHIPIGIVAGYRGYQYRISANRFGLPTIQRGGQMPINRNVLMFIIGLLVAVVAVLGYKQYQDSKQPDGVQINIGKDGLKIQNK